jgi:uncharacterized membrane protein
MILEDWLMKQNNLDLFWVIALAAALLLVTLLGFESVWLRALLAIPLALYGVGYAVGSAIYPQRVIGSPERLMLSMGLSLSVLIMGGLVLHILPGRLSPSSWAILLFWVTFLAASAALLRRWQGDQVEMDRVNSFDFRERVEGIGRGLRGDSSAVRILLIGMSVLLVAASLGLASQPAPKDAYQGYSMVWLLPNENGSQVELGIRSMEFEQQAYRVVLLAGGQPVQSWDEVSLAPKEDWTVWVDLTGIPAGGGPLEAHLYRLDQPEVLYRLARIWPDAQASIPGEISP